MIRHAWLKSSLALAITVAATSASANGIAINEQSASGMGTGFAGRSSSAEDASTLFGNPAGMSRLDRTEVSGGAALIMAKTDIDNASGSATGTNDGDMVPTSVIPFGYLVTPLNDRWHAGIGVYAPFGVISDYEDSFQGGGHGRYSKVQVVTLQPTLSFQVNDRISVGFGPTINHISGKLTSAFGNGEVNIKGDDVGYGFNAGVLVDVTDQLAWGLTYHSKVDYTLDGRTRLNNLPGPAAGANGEYDANLDFTTPESVDTSLTFELDPQWTLYAGATWTRWSRLDKIVVENDGVAAPFQPNFSEIEEPLNWEDTWAFAVGAAYQIAPQWTLRTGFTVDQSPVGDSDRTVRIPVSNRKVFSLGAGWDVSQDMTIDVAYSYLHESKGKIEQAAKPSTGSYNADYRNSAHGLSSQVTYRF